MVVKEYFRLPIHWTPGLLSAAIVMIPTLAIAQGGPEEAKAPIAADSSTRAVVVDDVDRPSEGPGSLISVEEHQPLRPPAVKDLPDEGASHDDQLKQLANELNYYRSGAEVFARDMKELITIKYNEQKDQLSSQYDRAIEELEDEERGRRLEAIARFEEFLRKYPNDAVYTPDAMFRLAELHFEKSSDKYLQDSRLYEDQLSALERGERETEPEPPEPSYETTIGLHRDLLVRFPEYRLADAARYLLGYCYGEQGQQKEALASYDALVTQHPDSRFLAEVWTRIGEIYFDGNDTESLEKAIEAYEKVKSYPDSPYYDKALYKIAWTYYRLDRYDEAVASFVGLVDYADEQKQLTGTSGSELRAEAIQYIAISLADEEWGGLERARTVLDPLDQKRYVGELWKRYGEILYDQTRYDVAIQVLNHTIDKYPNAPYNPEAQEKIVTAYEQLRDFDSATAAREKLVQNFSEGSAWHTANQDDREAVARAKALTEKSLYTAAIFRHQQAQAHKSAGRLSDARTSYLAAAKAYEAYLKRFPGSKNAYDFEFYLAECFYYSDDYQRAATQYDKVRDSQVDNKHLSAAALSSVITYEKEIERQLGSRAIKNYPLMTAKERKGAAIEPKQVAPIRKKLVDASDRFVKLLPKNPRSPSIAYRAGEVYYRHDQFEEARKRFEQIVQNYGGSKMAGYASNLIIESFLAADDFENVVNVSGRLMAIAEKNKGMAKDQKAQDKLIEELRTFNVGSLFKLAEKREQEGKFQEAADAYVQLVDKSPKHEFADKALFNAAVSYEKVKLFDSASRTYKRIYDQYPKSDLAPRSLFRVGINAEKGFDFPAAITAYTQLVERYPGSKNRADAMYNVAVVLENMQQYSQAAQAFKRYATTFSRRDDAGEIFYRSAIVYEKMEAWREMIDTLDAFIKKYKNKSSQKERIVEAYEKIGVAEAKRGKESRAMKAYRTCVSEYNKRRLGVKSKAAAHAATCAFELAEAEFRTYDLLQLKGSGKKQVKQLQKKAKLQRAVEKTYKGIFKYKRVDTTLGASFRIGYSYERFAEAMFNAPIPPEFKNKPEYAEEYIAQLQEKASVLERKAEAAYRKAYEEAKRTRVTNIWTQRIMEGLNKYAPKEFPIQKQGKALMQTFTITGHPLDDMGAKEKTPPKPDASTPPAPGGARTAEK